MTRSLASVVLVAVAGCAGTPTVSTPSHAPTAQKTPPSNAVAATYAERVAMRIKPNIVLADLVPEDAVTEVEIHADPGGKIIDYQVIRKSGSLAWDTAVAKAIERTAVLPLDATGTVPAVIGIVFHAR